MTDKQEKIADQMVELKDGKAIRVGEWLGMLALKLPQSFRYNKGKNKDKLVDHFIELINEFSKNGKKGILEYVEDCYNLLDKTVKESLPMAKMA